MRTPLLAVYATVLSCAPALAGDMVAHNCQCMGKTRSYNQGEVVCVNGYRMQCAMSLNVSSWKVLEGNCKVEDATARLSPLPRPAKLPATPRVAG